jgi:hypothetical protein
MAGQPRYTTRTDVEAMLTTANVADEFCTKYNLRLLHIAPEGFLCTPSTKHDDGSEYNSWIEL